MPKTQDQFMQFPMGKSLHWISRPVANGVLFIGFSLASNPKSPGGKHVTITVRETKTERLTPANQLSGEYLRLRAVLSEINSNQLIISMHFRWSSRHWTSNNFIEYTTTCFIGYKRVGRLNGFFIGFQGEQTQSNDLTTITNAALQTC